MSPRRWNWRSKLQAAIRRRWSSIDQGCSLTTVPSYVAGDLATWLEERAITHIRGAPRHPQTQGSREGPWPRWGRVSPEDERWHQTLKNRILLENYYLPDALETQIEAFVEHYNHRRYHESLNNLTPANVYFGRGKTILLERERIKDKLVCHLQTERRACRVIGQHRSTQRYQKSGRDDEAGLMEAVVELARMYGRCGYRRIWDLLCLQG